MLNKFILVFALSVSVSLSASACSQEAPILKAENAIEVTQEVKDDVAALLSIESNSAKMGCINIILLSYDKNN